MVDAGGSTVKLRKLLGGFMGGGRRERLPGLTEYPSDFEFDAQGDVCCHYSRG